MWTQNFYTYGSSNTMIHPATTRHTTNPWKGAAAFLRDKYRSPKDNDCINKKEIFCSSYIQRRNITDPFGITGMKHAWGATYLCKVGETCDGNEANF